MKQRHTRRVRRDERPSARILNWCRSHAPPTVPVLEWTMPANAGTEFGWITHVRIEFPPSL